MECVSNPGMLNSYLTKYNLSRVFEKDISHLMTLHSFNKGEYIFRANEKVEYLYFMVEGKAKVYTLLQNGKSLLLRFYKPFVVIGDVEFIEGNPATCNVEVTDPALCMGISLENLHKYTMDDSTFLTFICKSLGEKLAKNSMSSAINLLYPLENRLASYILAVAPQSGKNQGLDGIYTDKLTELADLLGTSYRHLIRTINNLTGEGIIEKSKAKIIIKDRASLEALAGDLYE